MVNLGYGSSIVTKQVGDCVMISFHLESAADCRIGDQYYHSTMTDINLMLNREQLRDLRNDIDAVAGDTQGDA